MDSSNHYPSPIYRSPTCTHADFVAGLDFTTFRRHYVQLNDTLPSLTYMQQHWIVLVNELFPDTVDPTTKTRRAVNARGQELKFQAFAYGEERVRRAGAGVGAGVVQERSGSTLLNFEDSTRGEGGSVGADGEVLGDVESNGQFRVQGRLTGGTSGDGAGTLGSLRGPGSPQWKDRRGDTTEYVGSSSLSQPELEAAIDELFENVRAEMSGMHPDRWRLSKQLRE